MEFANAINYVESKDNESVHDSGSDNLSGPITKESEAEEKSSSTAVRDPALRGLLGKGKSRIIFHLTLNMAKAAIYLMNETGFSIATLSQNNLLTDIKVCFDGNAMKWVSRSKRWGLEVMVSKCGCVSSVLVKLD